MEVAVASLYVGGIDAQMSKGGGQVPRAAPPAQRGASWVAGLVLIKRCGQRGGEVKAGQVRQRAAAIEPRRDAVRGRGRLLRRQGTKRTERGTMTSCRLRGSGPTGEEPLPRGMAHSM